MSNDSAMNLAVAAGSEPWKIFFSLSQPYLDRRLGRIEAILLMRNRTVAHVLELPSETAAIKREIQVVCNAFLIWKRLHQDLVRKFENEAAGADLAASLVWIGLKMADIRLRCLTVKLAMLEAAILTMSA